MEDPVGRAMKVGVRIGSGPPPGYLWNVAILGPVHDESMAFLSAEQYRHLASQMRELAREGEPWLCPTVDVRSIEDFFELRDKGGVLKKINARVFFGVCSETRTLVVLGAVNKKNDGQTPTYIKILMRYRWRRYVESIKGGNEN